MAGTAYLVEEEPGGTTPGPTRRRSPVKKLILAAIAASAFAAPVAAMAHEPVELNLPNGDTYYVDQDDYTLWQETNGKTGLQKTETVEVDSEGREKITPPDTQIKA